MSGHVMAAHAATTAGSQGLWLVSRASGVVLLILFSAVVVLGISTRTGATSRRWPRFAVAELHRTLSLFAVALLGLHVATALLDPYVSIGWISAVLPFTSHYETLAIGAGTLAVDIGGAVLITSLLRNRLGLRVWRAIHYLAYLAWPIAFVHAITAAVYDQHLWWVAASEWGSLTAVATAVIVRLVKRSRPGPVSEPPASTRRPVVGVSR
ncbi:MAG TPA: ferric reductase-like transmembrane domain-containing protein [Streptosporangiaceae bacterium]|jgi:sulfoxide reductase heme-binding subunit YedZ|nr:ferric reductase-like transmembrane domain-containing protein [Streptosporangiaceae bacterium]